MEKSVERGYKSPDKDHLGFAVNAGLYHATRRALETADLQKVTPHTAPLPLPEERPYTPSKKTTTVTTTGLWKRTEDAKMANFDPRKTYEMDIVVYSAPEDSENS